MNKKDRKILIIDGNLFARKMFYKFGNLSSKIKFKYLEKFIPQITDRIIRETFENNEEVIEIIDKNSGKIINLLESGKISRKLKDIIKKEGIQEDLITVETGVIYGILKSIISIYKKYSIRKIIFCYDPITDKSTHLRISIDEEYKVSRIPDKDNENKIKENENFFKQLFIAQNILKYLGVEQVWTKSFEADDLIHYFSKVAFKNEKCLLLTSDHDIFQCIDDNNGILIIGDRNTVYTRKNFIEEYKIDPSKLRDIMSLSGCSGDDVPGIKGIGKKTAIELIKNSGSLKNLLQNLEKLKISPKIKEKLLEDKRNGFKVIRKTRKLISLYGKHPLLKKEIFLNKISKEFLDSKKFIEILKMLRFKSILNKEEIEIIESIIKYQ